MKIIPVLLDFAMLWMHKEVNAEEPTKAVNAQSDDQNHKNSAHHLLKKHLSAIREEKEMGKQFRIHIQCEAAGLS